MCLILIHVVNLWNSARGRWYIISIAEKIVFQWFCYFMQNKTEDLCNIMFCIKSRLIQWSYSTVLDIKKCIYCLKERFTGTSRFQGNSFRWTYWKTRERTLSPFLRKYINLYKRNVSLIIKTHWPHWEIICQTVLHTQ